jgi:hypothetical protein
MFSEKPVMIQGEFGIDEDSERLIHAVVAWSIRLLATAIHGEYLFPTELNVRSREDDVMTRSLEQHDEIVLQHDAFDEACQSDDVTLDQVFGGILRFEDVNIRMPCCSFQLTISHLFQELDFFILSRNEHLDRSKNTEHYYNDEKVHHFLGRK